MHPVLRASLSALIGLALVLAPDAMAAPAKSKARPRLGLVLSGGGARGAAHIGVLEVLEELRVPVDLVTGTSMGSVVGGLYAAGLSPEELSATIQSVDWVDVFDDRPGRQELSFRRKQDDRTYLTNLRLGFKNWSLFIPSGIVEGQKLDFLLRSMTIDANGLAQIENLPLPFRAVATDIVTGEAVVFDKGPLAVAQRASMSIPAAFTPVINDEERVLVDGYVANNLPIDVAQEMGAERVIAVDISTPLSELKDLGTAVGIQGQVGTFSVQESQRRQIERLDEYDTVLRPDLGDLGAASFPRMAEAIEIGRQTALAHKEQLMRYSVSQAEYEAWRAKQRRPPVTMPVIDAVRLENRSLLSDSVVRARIHVKPGEPLDLEQLSNDLARLFGLDAFERVRFDVRRESGTMVLIYQVEARQRGTHYLRMGLNLESDLGDDSDFNIGVNHVWFPANRFDGELRSGAQVGDTLGFGSEYYQPLDAKEWFFAMPFVEWKRTEEGVFERQDEIARYAVEQTLSGLFAGVNLGNVAQLRGGIGYVDGEARPKIGDRNVFHTQRYNGGLYAAILEYDTLDDTRFPNDGSYALVESLFFNKDLGFDEDFERVRSFFSTFRTWRRNTIGLAARYDTSFNTKNPSIESVHSLGGFMNLSGFERGSLVSETVGLARLLTYRRIASPAVFAWEFPVYAGGYVEIGNAWEDRSDIDNDNLLSGGPFVGVDTPLGPLYLSYAYGEGGNHQGYLYLGRTFGPK